VRDGPSREDPRLLRKTDTFKEELGLDVRVTVARPVAAPGVDAPASPGSSGELRAVRHRAN
jgi:hypothetical protein